MAAFSPPSELQQRTQAWEQIIDRALQGSAASTPAAASAPAPQAAAASSPPVYTQSALSAALVQNGLAAVRTASALSPSPPPSPARSSGGLSPEASSTPRSALTAALRQAGLAGAAPLATS
jgi:hypothetical protein